MTHIVRECPRSAVVELVGLSRTYGVTPDYVAWVKAEYAVAEGGSKSERAHAAVSGVAKEARRFGGWQEFHRCMIQLESLR